MTDFKPSEKIHVTLMIAEAKIQAQLLYALRAVDDYLKWPRWPLVPDPRLEVHLGTWIIRELVVWSRTNYHYGC